jgi:hypothetical protein
VGRSKEEKNKPVQYNQWQVGKYLTQKHLKVGPPLLLEIVVGRLSYQSSYGFASGQIHHRSQETLLPLSGEPKVSNPWNNVQHKDSI